MKILWHSVAPWAPTGYGQQTSLFAPRLRDAGHDVALSAYWGLAGSALHWDGMSVFPSDHNWGNDYLPLWVDEHSHGEPVQVISLMDVWVLHAQMIADLDRCACWVPVDHDPCPPRVAEFFVRSGATPIAMSKFGEARLRDAGLAPLYVPHGVDTSLFAPREDRGNVRDAFGLPRDAFVVGMVANNQGKAPPRKAFPQALMAFAELRSRHDDAVLYLHTDLLGAKEGINLVHLLETFGIPPQAVCYPPAHKLETGSIDQAAMAALYATMDVLLSPSYGEGFGVPIIEAQACGTPVIVTDWTSMPELCGAGWVVGGEPWYDSQHLAFFMSPDVGEIVEALDAAYSEAEGLREKARAFALSYDADRIAETYWAAALAQLESAGAKVADPGMNRAMRRAAARRKEPAAA